MPVDAPLHYKAGELYMDGVALSDIAEAIGSPTYVYSATAIEAAISDLQSAFARVPMRLHYAVKANDNLHILRLVADTGCGFDIVSGGELHRVVAAGGDPGDVIFSGVGKTVEELDLGLKLGIACFNVESAAEMQRLSERAALHNCQAPVSVRVNPDVDAQTHPYISTGLHNNKFGVPVSQALALYEQAHADDHLTVIGIDCHIGSQINQIEPLLEALTSLLDLVDQLAKRDIVLQHIDLGGGMGITYKDETALDVHAYGASVAQILGNRSQHIILEPGRSLTANAGVLLTRVEYLKPAMVAQAPSFAVIDAAMNDLIRPALYQAWHDVVPLQQHSDAEAQPWHLVGPVCESGDFIAHDRELALQPDDVLAICSAGAYGRVQASNYNTRGRPAEVLVRDRSFSIIRRRETIEDQLRLEREV